MQCTWIILKPSPSPTRVHGKIFFHETGPWGPKCWHLDAVLGSLLPGICWATQGFGVVCPVMNCNESDQISAQKCQIYAELLVLITPLWIYSTNRITEVHQCTRISTLALLWKAMIRNNLRLLITSLHGPGYPVTNKMEVTLWTDMGWPPGNWNRKISVQNIICNMEAVPGINKHTRTQKECVIEYV